MKSLPRPRKVTLQVFLPLLFLSLGVLVACDSSETENGDQAIAPISASVTITGEILEATLTDDLESFDQGSDFPADQALVRIDSLSAIDNPGDVELPEIGIGDELEIEFTYGLRPARVENVFVDEVVDGDSVSCSVESTFSLDNGVSVYSRETCNEDQAGVDELPGLEVGDSFEATLVICPSCPVAELQVSLYEKTGN